MIASRRFLFGLPVVAAALGVSGVRSLAKPFRGCAVRKFVRGQAFVGVPDAIRITLKSDLEIEALRAEIQALWVGFERKTDDRQRLLQYVGG